MRAGVTRALASLLTLVPVPALADAQYDKCIDRNMTNTAWAECGWNWVEREDARLNTAWKHAYPSLPAKAKAAMLTEQRAWIAYKDKSCKWQATGDFGREGQVLDAPRCRAEIIAARADYLDAIGRRGE